MSVFNIYESGHFDAPLSYAMVGLLEATLLGCAAFCAYQYLASKRAAAEAKAPDLAPSEGARFVSGVVEYARDEKAAVKVTIWQSGTEVRHKNGANHTWKEYDRETVAKPFYVRRADDSRVRVDPTGGEVLLVDELDCWEWTERDKRGRRAELTPGESVLVEGTLTRGSDPESSGAGAGYRDAGSSWVVRPRDGRIHCSTEGLARRHELRARAFANALIWVFVALLGSRLPLYSFYARLSSGADVQAQFEDRTFWISRNSKGQSSSHWGVRLDVPQVGGGTQRTRFEVSHSDYNRLPERGTPPPVEEPDRTAGTFPPPFAAYEPTSLFVRVVASSPSSTALGRGSSMSFGLWLFGVAWAALAVWRTVVTHRYRRWYEGKLVESKSGSLPTPTGQRFEGSKRKRR